MLKATIAAFLIAGFSMGAQAGTTMRAAITDHFFLPLEEARELTDRLYDRFAGADGEPITIEEFMSVSLADPVPEEANGQEMKLNLFKLLDADGDARVSRNEWIDRLRMDLSAADANNDGELTVGELTFQRSDNPADTVLILLF